MSIFDVASLKSASFDSGFSTQIKGFPDGDYLALTKKYALRPAKSKSGEDLLWLDVVFEVDGGQAIPTGETIQAVTGKPSVTARWSTSLEFTPGGTLDRSEGHNVGLGRLLEALGLNKGSWNFEMLLNRPAKISTSCRRDETTGDEFVDVKRVMAP